MTKRKYTKTIRAQQQAQTRERIVAAAMHLHEELGPRETTISAVAQRAGVQRLTVYRHFPSENELFQACSSHWLQLNPPPGKSAWEGEPDPMQRALNALLALFSYFRQTQKMWSLVYRDEKDVPAMQQPLKEFHGYLDQVRDELLAAWTSTTSEQQRQLKSTLGHCLKFSTWQSLDREGHTDQQMGALVSKWLLGITLQGGANP